MPIEADEQTCENCKYTDCRNYQFPCTYCSHIIDAIDYWEGKEEE